MGDGDALLRSLNGDDPQEIAEAAIRLGEGGIGDALPRLRELATSDNDLVTVAAIYACWRLGEDRIDADRIVDALGSAREDLAQLAIHVVCEIGGPMVYKLTPLLRGPADRAAIAMRALDDIHEPQARRAIAALRSGDPDIMDLKKAILDDWTSDAQEDG